MLAEYRSDRFHDRRSMPAKIVSLSHFAPSDARQRKRRPSICAITVPKCFRYVLTSPCSFCGEARLIRKACLLRLVNAPPGFFDNSVVKPSTHETSADREFGREQATLPRSNLQLLSRINVNALADAGRNNI